MTKPSHPKRILPVAVVGARTNTGAIFESASSAQAINGKRVARVGDTFHDPLDGEVTIMTGLDGLVDGGRLVAGLGCVLSNGSFIVDAGQSHVCWVELGDDKASVVAGGAP